jgi:hexosaminidase
LSPHAFDDPTGGLAAALLTIGDAHRAVTPQIPNHSILAMHLYFPQIRVGRGITKGITDAELQAVGSRLAEARADVARAKPERDDRALLVDEVRWTIDVLELLTDDARARIAGDSTLGSVPQAQRDDFARRLAALTDQHRALWLARNRPGGLVDSVAWLDNLRVAYTTGQPAPTWGGWPKRFT